jgi:hypothetical protein
MELLLERDPEKWIPVFRKIARQFNNLEHNRDPIHRDYALGLYA